MWCAMSKTASFDLAGAVVLRLRSDATLTSLINGVFDEVPLDINEPYVQVGDQIETPFNTFDKFGKQITFPIGIFTVFEGFEQAMKIYGRILELLDYQNFVVNQFHLVFFRFTDSTFERNLSERENNTSVKGIVMNFQAILQES